MSDDEKIELVWEAPPDPWVKSQYRPHVEAVKKRPGAWLKVRGPVRQALAYNTVQGMKKLFNGDTRFEVTVRRLNESECSVYLRYRTPEQMREE